MLELVGRRCGLLGGGVKVSTTNRAVNIDSLEPSTAVEWQAWVNNPTGSAKSFTVWAICQNTAPPGFARATGTTVFNGTGQTTGAFVQCPGASVPLSGGVYSDGTGQHQNMSESFPFANYWLGSLNNNDPTNNTITIFAICAGN